MAVLITVFATGGFGERLRSVPLPVLGPEVLDDARPVVGVRELDDWFRDAAVAKWLASM